MSATFQVGARYWAQSAGDSNCIWWFTVTARTDKFVTFREEDPTIRPGDSAYKMIRVGVKTDDQGEWVMPFGRYSMAPVVRACRTVEDLPPSLRPKQWAWES